MDADQRRKNDEHPESKGGETKLLRGGEINESGTFSIASAEASPLHGKFLSQSTERRRGILETFLPKSKRSFRKQSKPNGKECSISRR